MGTSESIYYNPSPLLSYNRILNFVTGGRGIGKSYGYKTHVVKRFKKHKKRFVYVRRYKTELKKFNKFCDDIKEQFPGDELKVKGREIYINGELAGYGIPLSSWQNEKSNAYPDVETILFDEFIREKDNVGYLPNEVESLLNLMDTVFRNREDVRCICMSNSSTIVNPYYVYFQLFPQPNVRFTKNDDIVVEIVPSGDFIEHRRQTRFGKLIDGTNYGSMSLDNEFVNDSDVFVERRSKTSKFKFTIIFKGVKMGVWVDVRNEVWYVSKEHDPNTNYVYALTSGDHNQDTNLLQNWRKNGFLNVLIRGFTSGNVRFENQVIRSAFYEMVSRMRL